MGRFRWGVSGMQGIRSGAGVEAAMFLAPGWPAGGAGRRMFGATTFSPIRPPHPGQSPDGSGIAPIALGVIIQIEPVQGTVCG